MRGIPLLFTVAAFLAGVGIALTARSGRVLASEQSDTHAADRAGVEKLHRAGVEATFTQEPIAMSARWSDDDVNLQTPGAPTVGTVASKSLIANYGPRIRSLRS